MMIGNAAEHRFNINQHSLGFLFVLFLCVLNCSLNAPRDNPLDHDLGGNICGRVLSRNSYGIADVEIFIPQADVITYSDTSGDFGLYVLPEDSMWVFFTHIDYAPESVMVITETGKIDTLTVYLNGLPFLIDYKVTTHRYERNWPPDPLYFCVLSTAAGDIDGEVDIESVWVEIPAFSYIQRLIYDSFKQKFIHTLFVDEIPGQNLEALVGKDILFNIADKDSAVVQSSPCYISRIIYQSPDIIFPKGGLDTLRTDTTFIWHKYTCGFYVYYHGEVVKITGGGPGGVVYSFDIHEQNDTTCGLSLLGGGEYYWTLEIIDSLGNSARTKEERFIVEK